MKSSSITKLVAIAAVWLVVSLTQTAAAFDDGATEYISVPAGSYIIDMCQAVPTVENNLKPYGMIFDLVQTNKIPVYWAINPSKGDRDSTDFTVDGQSFCSGSFIIDATYAITPEAQSVISTWRRST